MNASGGLAWLGGLSYAKGMSVFGALAAADNHRVLVGMTMCAAAVLLLLWANLRDAV